MSRSGSSWWVTVSCDGSKQIVWPTLRTWLGIVCAKPLTVGIMLGELRVFCACLPKARERQWREIDYSVMNEMKALPLLFLYNRRIKRSFPPRYCAPHMGTHPEFFSVAFGESSKVAIAFLTEGSKSCATCCPMLTLAIQKDWKRWRKRTLWMCIRTSGVEKAFEKGVLVQTQKLLKAKGRIGGNRHNRHCSVWEQREEYDFHPAIDTGGIYETKTWVLVDPKFLKYWIQYSKNKFFV